MKAAARTSQPALSEQDTDLSRRSRTALAWRGAAIAIAAFSCIWCLSVGGTQGAAFDETIYLVKGLERWSTGSHSGLLRIGTMPLPPELTTLPLHFFSESRSHPVTDIREAAPLMPLLQYARATALIFWLVLLVYAWTTGLSLAGEAGGCLAVALIATEPSFLAHASLATTDIAVTASLLAMTWHFRESRDSGFWRHIGIPALWFAAALLSKASALVFGPLCLLFSEVRLQKTPEAHRPIPRRMTHDVIWVTAIGVAITFIYCGSDWQVEPSFVEWSRTLPTTWAGDLARWFASHLRIFTNAGDGLVRQMRHNIRGHGAVSAYIAGRTGRAFWYYFPLALSIKLSPVLLLLPLLLALWSPASLTLWPNMVAAGLFVLSPLYRVQIGIRLVLPIIAFAAVGIGAACAKAIESAKTSRLGVRVVPPALAAGLLFNLYSAFALWPDLLRYVSPFWGGPETGYRYVSDSNYDWGQGIPGLAQWQRQHSDAPLDVWYFGTDPAVLNYRMVNDLMTKGLSPGVVRGHYLAVSATFLYGAYLEEPATREIDYLKSLKPIAKTPTFFIYDFRTSP